MRTKVFNVVLPVIAPLFYL